MKSCSLNKADGGETGINVHEEMRFDGCRGFAIGVILSSFLWSIFAAALWAVL
jgi:hypothetical protein